MRFFFNNWTTKLSERSVRILVVCRSLGQSGGLRPLLMAAATAAPGCELHAHGVGAVAGLVGLGWGGAMDVPADQSMPKSTPRGRAPIGIRWSPRRRRPTGEPPPLPYHLQTSGV